MHVVPVAAGTGSLLAHVHRSRSEDADQSYASRTQTHRHTDFWKIIYTHCRHSFGRVIIKSKLTYGMLCSAVYTIVAYRTQ